MYQEPDPYLSSQFTSPIQAYMKAALSGWKDCHTSRSTKRICRLASWLVEEIRKSIVTIWKITGKLNKIMHAEWCQSNQVVLCLAPTRPSIKRQKTRLREGFLNQKVRSLDQRKTKVKLLRMLLLVKTRWLTRLNTGSNQIIQRRLPKWLLLIFHKNLHYSK